MEMILVVDTNMDVYERQTAEWDKVGIASQRVDTMHEAINILVRGGTYFMVAINEDTNPNCLEQLPFMDDSTESPIFVISSTYTMDKGTIYMNAGADCYGPFSAFDHGNVLSALIILQKQNKRNKQQEKTMSILISNDIILSGARRAVCVRGKLVKLTKLEFDILYYLMTNSDLILTHTQILLKIKGDEEMLLISF